jgi:cyclase
MDKPVRIMPCLDMQQGRVVKGVHFVDIRDAGDPVECARAYCAAGADELAMLDITATVEGRETMLEVVKRVAAVVTVPFTVGGGIATVEMAARVLEAGATRISTSSGAFRHPDVIAHMVREFGAERVTVAIDVDVNSALPSGYEVYIDGGRTPTGTDAIDWAQQVDSYGVGCILPTSKAGDGARTGYDLPVIRKMADVANAPVVASGGAGTMENVSASDVIPSGSFKPLNAQAFTIEYPSNWQPSQDQQGGGVTIAPQAGVGQGAIAYGTMISAFQPQQAKTMDDAVNELVSGLAQQNPGLRASASHDITVNGTQAKSVDLVGQSPLGSKGQPLQEHDWLVAMPYQQNSVVYLVFISPERDFSKLRPTFEHMLKTFRLNQ